MHRPFGSCGLAVSMAVATLLAPSLRPQHDSAQGNEAPADSRRDDSLAAILEASAAGDPGARRELRNRLAHRAPLEVPTLGELSAPALEALILGLAERPRSEFYDLVAEGRSAALDTGTGSRLGELALFATDPQGLSRDEVWTIFGLLSSDDLDERLAAREVLLRLPSAQADRVSGEILRRLSLGQTFDSFLPLLERMGRRGLERLGSALDQIGSGKQEADAVAWLHSKDEELAQSWAERAFRRGRDGPLVLGYLSAGTLAENLDRVLGVVGNPEASLRTRETAVRRLLQIGAVADDRLARAVSDPRLLTRRLVAELASREWPSARPFAELDALVDFDLSGLLIRGEDGFDVLLALYRRNGSESALRTLLREGPRERALELWDALSESERRQGLAPLSRREDDAGRERLEDLRAFGSEAFVARLRLGDSRVIDEWVELDSRFSLRAVRSFAELAAPLLAERHVGAFRALLLDPTAPERERRIVCELARLRLDLPFVAALEELLRRSPGESLAEEAERALFARAEVRRRAVERALADTEVGGRADREAVGREPSIALLDSLPATPSPAEATLLARTVLAPDWSDLSRRLALRRFVDPGPALVTALEDELADIGSTLAPNAGPDQLLLITLLADPRLRQSCAPLYAKPFVREAPGDEIPARERFLCTWIVAEDHERAGRLVEAAGLYDRALRVLETIGNWSDARIDLARPEPPDSGRRSDRAFRSVRPGVCRLRSALARGDLDEARRQAGLVERLALGDDAAETEARELSRELR